MPRAPPPPPSLSLSLLCPPLGPSFSPSPTLPPLSPPPSSPCSPPSLPPSLSLLHKTHNLIIGLRDQGRVIRLPVSDCESDAHAREHTHAEKRADSEVERGAGTGGVSGANNRGASCSFFQRGKQTPHPVRLWTWEPWVGERPCFLARLAVCVSDNRTVSVCQILM